MTTVSNMTRISGLASGLDTESIIKDLMKIEYSKVDKVKQQKQLVSWQQESYREVSTLLLGFQSSHFDLLKPEDNLRSATAFNTFVATATRAGVSTSKVSVSASAETATAAITIAKIEQLAKGEEWRTQGRIKSISGTEDIAARLADINTEIAAGNDQFYLTVDGVKKAITLSGGYGTAEDMRSDMQTQINAIFGANTSSVALVSGSLEVNLTGREAKLESLDANLLGTLGIADGSQNFINTSQSLATVFGVTDDDIQLTINGVSNFNIKKTDSISVMMSKINSSSAGVRMSYDAVSGQFSMTNNKTGYVNEISIGTTDDSASFLANFGLNEAQKTRGQDALLNVNGAVMTSMTNEVRISGVTVTLNETLDELDGPINIAISNNTDKVVDRIKKFVEKYNEIIEKITSKLSEKREYDFDPLTDEQKEAMEEDEIKNWESRAKKGLLRSDSLLQRIVGDLRRTFVDSIEDMGITANQIGIEMSSNYKDGGKITLNESKLKEALANKGADVVNFFTKQSDTTYDDVDNRGTRYSENGLIYRIYDVLRDNIRTTIDSNGSRGALVEKAGIEGLSSAVTSELSKRILDYDARIGLLMDKLYAKEDTYYQQFTRLETAMARFNQQSSFIAGNFGGGA